LKDQPLIGFDSGRLSMQQFESERPARSQTVEPTWYHAYFLAMVEHDRNKALSEIEKARDAIQQRTRELQYGAPSSPREVQDLMNALTYLRILLTHMNAETATLLWD
jgi:hypothetical protein